MSRKRSHLPADLTPYTGCAADEILGLDPLAIGWLDKRSEFETGYVSDRFVAQLGRFCHPSVLVGSTHAKRPCGFHCKDIEPVVIDGEKFPLGRAEIRVIGEEDIFASPDLIYHYVTVHKYRPPKVFVDAVLHGPQPDSAEYRALIRTLQQVS